MVTLAAMGSIYNLGASVVYHTTVAKFETFQQCQQSIKSTHSATILPSIIAVNIQSFQSFYFQPTGLFIKIKQEYHQTCMYWL